MAQDHSHERLIRDLAARLAPVRVASPSRLMMAWLATAAVIAAGLAVAYDPQAMLVRLRSADDLWLAAAGSLATAVLAAKAAFELAIPGRSRLWALLPLPAAMLWLGASGMGCLRTWAQGGGQGGEGLECLKFIIGVSAPLAIAIVVLLRRAFPVYPVLTASLAGLACAAGASALLNLCHPFDTTATDLAVHVVAVVLVIGAVMLSGGRMLRR